MSWTDIYGHEDAKRLLQAHLAAHEVPGGYLFVGPEGVGKRQLALEMAKALNCTAAEAERPCGGCPTCLQIAKGTHPDLHLLLPVGASDQVKIESVRQLLGRFALRPFNAAVQVALIDGADRLTEEAANALLKALEEPSRSARFLLTTSRLADCLPTIVSRCQIIRCGRLPLGVIARLLVDRHGCDAGTAQAAARLSDGSAARALELTQRWDAYQETLARLGSERPQAEWMQKGMPETRQELAQLLEDMTAWLRDVAVAASGSPERVAHADHAEAVRRQASSVDMDRCLEAAFELMSLRDSLEQFANPRLVAALAKEKWLELLEGVG